MENNDIKQQVLIFSRARNNLLAVVAFTVINIILSALDAGVNFLFSATIPQVIFEICKGLDSDSGSNLFTVIGLIIAAIIIITYVVFWLLSKNLRVFILVALIFFAVDSLVLVFIILNVEFTYTFLLEIAFHGWILYYLINGVRAWSKLSGVDTDVFNTILQEAKTNK